MLIKHRQSSALAAAVICGGVAIIGCSQQVATSDSPSLISSSKYLDARKTPNEEPKTSKKLVPFEHDKALDTYLRSVCGFMLEAPNDGKFGYTRVQPMGIHATRSNLVKGYDEVEKLTKDYVIRTFVVGTKLPTEANIPKSYFDSPSSPKLDLSPVRMNEVVADKYKYFSASHIHFDNPQPFEPELVDAVLVLKPILDATGYDDYSEAITVKGKKGNLMAKAVRAPDKSCLQCHANIKPGQPIGYAIATIWKK